jgi:phospholipid-binding lipoprotein MlaA
MNTFSPPSTHPVISNRPLGLMALVAAATLLGGCATVERPDPLEPMNRKIFAFNEGVDKAVVKPVATAYKTVVPSPVRSGVTNFLSNLGDPWSALNLLLQGRLKDSASDVARFATNTVVGIFGLLDVASDHGLPRHGEDFGKTLGAWGVGPGAYLVLPLLGPSDLRDTATIPIDAFGQPQGRVSSIPIRNSLTGLKVVNGRSNALAATKMLDEGGLDKYSFLRDVYLNRRNGRLRDEEAAPPESLTTPQDTIPAAAKEPARSDDRDTEEPAK